MRSSGTGRPVHFSLGDWLQCATQGRAGDVRAGGPGDEPPRESAAGPEAVAAAERAMGNLGGAGDGRGVRSVEHMMERFIERAYANELNGMEARGQGRPPRAPACCSVCTGSALVPLPAIVQRVGTPC
jgi:hypothetical protein